MALSAFLDPETLEFQPSLLDLLPTRSALPDLYEGTSEEEDLHNTAVAAFSGYGQEQDTDGDEADGPVESHTARTYERDEREEPVCVVERLLETTEKMLTPTVAFDRAFYLLEQRSRPSYTEACYRGDCYKAAWYVLQDSPYLWRLYVLLFEDRHADCIPHGTLMRSHDVQQIKYLVGKEIRSRRLHNYTAYAHSVRSNHSDRKRQAV
jgi:hypothetical protein